MVLFNKCCFCIPLKTGCLILGYLQLVVAIVSSVLAGMTLHNGIYLSRYSYYAQQANNFMTIGSILLVLYLAVFCISVVVLVGLHNSKPSLIKAYLIFGVITVVLGLIMFAAQLVYSNIHIDSLLEYSIRQIVPLAFIIYFLLVSKSYYTVLKEGQQSSNMRMQKI